LADLVEEGLGADGLFAVDGGERFGDGLVGLGGLDDGAVGADGCSDDQGECKGIAWPGVNLGGALWPVDDDDRVVGAFAEAVDADLAHGAAEGLDQVGGEVGAEWPDELGAVAEKAEGDLDGGLVPDEDRQAPPALGLLEQDDVARSAGLDDAADVADRHVEGVLVCGGWHDGLLHAPRRERRVEHVDATGARVGEGEAGAPVTGVWLPGRRAAGGRPQGRP
jgi:hypothetical protein